MQKIFIGFALLIFSSAFLLAEIDEWRLRIGVKADRCQDTYNFIGVSKKASLYYDPKDLPEPPLPPEGLTLTLYFPHEDWIFLPGKYATDIRPPIRIVETYEFVVEASEYRTLTLFWPNIDNLPEEYKFVLVDREKNILVDMRKAREYAFDCHPGEKNRFKIICSKEIYTGLQQKWL